MSMDLRILSDAVAGDLCTECGAGVGIRPGLELSGRLKVAIR